MQFDLYKKMKNSVIEEENDDDEEDSDDANENEFSKN